MNNNKKKGIIYKIEVGNDLYVGSTKSYYLSDRQSVHNNDYKYNKQPTVLLYIKAKENNIDKLKCIFICNFYYDTVEELRQEEEKYRIELKANLNMVKAYRKNKNDKTEYYKNYSDKMKTDLEYREKRLQQKKNDYEKNKKKILEKQKEYREKNKNVINEKQNVKVKCEFCNCEMHKNNLKRHQKSKKCLNNR